MRTCKLLQLAGVLILLVGVVIRAGAGEFYGVWIAVLGLLLYAVARVAAWLKSDRP